MSIKVIGAGFGRTGTHSLKLALEELGFGKCYHMDELIEHHPEKLPFWKEVKAGKKVDWDAFYEGFQSTVDLPSCVYYKELMEKYPEAKVILTVRNPESWYKSFGDTIIKASSPSIGDMLKMSIRLPFNKILRQRLNTVKFAGSYLKDFFPDGFENKESTIRSFNTWNENVKAYVPSEKLLVYDVKEGWEPLCRFLNVTIPSKPFPHSNTTKEFNSRKL